MGPWPRFIYPQILARYDNVDAKEYGKLSKVRRRGYVILVEVKSSTHQFPITNGEETIMLYKGTYSSMNTSLWVSHFVIPMVGYTLRAVEKGTFTAYRYII